jgi:hypothetical protein
MRLSWKTTACVKQLSSNCRFGRYEEELIETEKVVPLLAKTLKIFQPRSSLLLAHILTPRHEGPDEPSAEVIAKPVWVVREVELRDDLPVIYGKSGRAQSGYKQAGKILIGTMLGKYR